MSDETIPAPGYRPIEPSPDEPVHDLGPAASAILEHGLLWALNQFVAHGRGFELIVLPTGNIGVKGDGGALRDWGHVDPDKVDAAMRRFRQALLDAQGANKRVHQAARHQGHSPGFRTIGPPTTGVPKS